MEKVRYKKKVEWVVLYCCRVNKRGWDDVWRNSVYEFQSKFKRNKKLSEILEQNYVDGFGVRKIKLWEKQKKVIYYEKID